MPWRKWLALWLCGSLMVAAIAPTAKYWYAWSGEPRQWSGDQWRVIFIMYPYASFMTCAELRWWICLFLRSHKQPSVASEAFSEHSQYSPPFALSLCKVRLLSRPDRCFCVRLKRGRPFREIKHAWDTRNRNIPVLFRNKYRVPIGALIGAAVTGFPWIYH